MKMKPIYFRIFLLFCISFFYSFFAHAQISTKGKDFWVSFMQANPTSARRQLLLSSEQAATVVINAPLFPWTTTVTVPANGTTLVDNIPVTALTGSGIGNIGINITSTVDISVFAVHFAGNRSEATSVLPITALGSSTEYIISSYEPNFTGERSEFVVVAINDNSQIEITPSVDTSNGWAAGSTNTITLNRGQAFQVQANLTASGGMPGGDLSGTIVKSKSIPGNCKGFAVFAGMTASGLPTICTSASSLQHLYEQQYPIVTWGKEYVMTPYTNIAALSAFGVIGRITALEDNTTVTINNGGGRTATFTLNRAARQDITNATLTGTDISKGIFISSNKPISVAQYSRVQACNLSNPPSSSTGNGDASLLLLTPINQATQKVTVAPVAMGSVASQENFINVTLKTADIPTFSITPGMGGGIIGGVNFFPIEAKPDYSYAVIEILNTVHSYTLEATAGFGAFIYGYGGPDAYAYSVGATFENQQINFTVTPSLNVCKGTAYNFSGFGTGTTGFEWDLDDDGNYEASGVNQMTTFMTAGTKVVRMKATGLNLCGGFTIVEKELKVLELPTPNLGANQNICIGETATLNANATPAAPAGQSYTYQWFKDNDFGSVLGTGTTFAATVSGKYTVRVKNAEGNCTVGESSMVLTVNPKPILAFTTVPTTNVCINDAISNLAATPTGAGGTMTVDGMPTTVFNPALLGEGAHIIKYEYEDAMACKDFITKTVTVNPLPDTKITGLLDKYCQIDKVYTLTGTPTGGVFKVDGMTSPNFNPKNLTVGKHYIDYEATTTAGCKKSVKDSFDIEVKPVLKFLNINDVYCYTEATFTVQVSPVGGKIMFKGNEITQINPNELEDGDYVIEYQYSAAPADCDFTLKDTFKIVKILPLITLAKTDYCITDEIPIPLTAFPTGGKFFIGATEVTELKPSLYALGDLKIKYSYIHPTSNCQFDTAMTVKINGIPNVKIEGINAFYCKNERPFTPTVTPTGGTFKLNGAAVTLPINPANLTAGTYILEYNIKSAVGCGASVKDTFDIRPLHTVKVSVSKILYCSNDAAILITGTPAGGKVYIAGVESPTKVFLPSKYEAGKFWIKYAQTSSITGCTVADSVEVQVVTPPEARLGDDIEACQSTAGVTVNAKLGIHDENITYLWSTGETTPSMIVTKLGVTTLTVTVSNKLACESATDDIVVNVYPVPEVDLGKDFDACDKDLIKLNAKKDTHIGMFTYLWSTGSTKSEIEVKDKGTKLYWVQVTDNNYPAKCPKRDTIIVNFKETPVNNLGADVAVCDPKNVPYKVIGKDLSHEKKKITYKWFDLKEPKKSISDSAYLMAVKTGFYILEVTDTDTKCSRNDSIQVTFNLTPELILGGHDSTRCQKSDTLIVFNTNVKGMKIEWKGAGIVSIATDKLSAVVNKSGIYSVTVTDDTKDTKCSRTEILRVFLADFPTTSKLASKITACQDSTFTLNVSDSTHSSSFKYKWKNLRTNAEVSTTAAIKMTFALTGAAVFEPNGTASTKFEISITPPSGCLSKDTIEIVYQEKSKAVIDKKSYPAKICLGEKIAITASGGTIYKWKQLLGAPLSTTTTSPTTTTSAATVNFKPTLSGRYQFLVEVRNGNGACSATYDTANFVVNPLVPVKLPQKRLLACEDQPVEVDAFLASQPLLSKYEWRKINLDGSYSNILYRTSKVIFKFSEQKTYDSVRYEVLVRDSLTGCASRDTVQVTFIRKSLVKIDRNFKSAFCIGDSVKLFATGALNYKWNIGKTGANVTIIPNRAGVFTYIVEGSYQNTCPPSTDTVRVTVYPLPVAVANPEKNISICPNETVTLTASGGVRYRWRHGDTTAVVKVKPAADTWYRVKVYSQFGCSADDSVFVRVTPRFDLPPTVTLCEGETAKVGQVSPALPARYLWNNGDTIPVLTVKKAGVYIVTVTAEKCTYSDTTEVIYREKPRFIMKKDTIVCFVKPNEVPNDIRRLAHEIEANLSKPKADEIYYYEWFFADGTRKDANRVAKDGKMTFEVEKGGKYTLKVRSNFGCVWEDTILVTEICEPRFKMPDSFTPNDDKLNDLIAPLTSDITQIEFQIYNRWGQVIYEKELNQKQGWNGIFVESDGWDGTFEGKNCPVGMYQWVAVFWGLDMKGKRIRHSARGDLNLIREMNR